MNGSARSDIAFEGDAPVSISRAVRVGDLVFVAGIGSHYFRSHEVAFDATGEVTYGGSGYGDPPIERQTHDTLDELTRILAAARCGLADVVDAIVWLRDPRDFVGFNTVWAARLGANRPAREVLRNVMMFRTRIEIKVTVHPPSSDPGGILVGHRMVRPPSLVRGLRKFSGWLSFVGESPWGQVAQG